ncbi:S-layer homology domain-containing protein [Paenibacillus pasadenensis]|uniref:S-layer homology domain-containing protein n=1 Tax=Paenibacillus pasadenensis TaxID=217090 RepID=UPI00203BE580|nr:S-layer homology domain-containing protein [Paenibacillus pasadenensis]MCM3746240.1 S-layer homology domain-containing protein [Paenibacillus pasadenensis]
MRLKGKAMLAGGLAGLMLAVSAPGAVFAFTDITQDPNAASIRSLESAGIIGGTGNSQFKPQEAMTYAQAVTLLVKAFDLNLNAIKFVQKPEASHYFPGMNDNAWYSEAFIIAAIHNLDLDPKVKPAAAISREQFAHLLLQAIGTTGDYAFTEIFIELSDGDQVDDKYEVNVQRLLISGIAKLGEDGLFKPKEAVTRSSAAAWVDGGISFVEQMKKTEEPEGSSASPLQSVALEASPHGEGVSKITVTAQAPHPGYGIRIAGIRFNGDKAYITVEAVKPKPGQMYPQVITDVSATTYIDAAYTAVLENTGGSDSSTGGILNGKNAR